MFKKKSEISPYTLFLSRLLIPGLFVDKNDIKDAKAAVQELRDGSALRAARNAESRNHDVSWRLFWARVDKSLSSLFGDKRRSCWADAAAADARASAIRQGKRTPRQQAAAVHAIKFVMLRGEMGERRLRELQREIVNLWRCTHRNVAAIKGIMVIQHRRQSHLRQPLVELCLQIP